MIMNNSVLKIFTSDWLSSQAAYVWNFNMSFEFPPSFKVQPQQQQQNKNKYWYICMDKWILFSSASDNANDDHQ